MIGALAPLCAALALGSPATGGAAPGATIPSSLPLAQIDEQLDVQGVPIAAQIVRTRLSIPVTIDGHGPYAFLIDSAADRSVIGRGLARRLALPSGGCTRVHGLAGVSLVDTVRVGQLGVGGSAIDDEVAPILPEASIGAAGILGIDSLAGQRLMLDFVTPAATIEDARTADVDAKTGDIVVTARARHGQLILAHVIAGSTPIVAVIDTGAELSVGNEPLRRALLGGRRPLDSQVVQLTSVTGETVNAQLASVPAITIGGLVIRNVPIAFVDAPPFALFGIDRTPALLLGTDVLQGFRRVTLDFRRRRVRFSLRPR